MGFYDHKIKQDRGETIMIMFDIAEWVANVLVLGLGLFFWSLFFGISFLIISELVSKVTNES